MVRAATGGQAVFYGAVVLSFAAHALVLLAGNRPMGPSPSSAAGTSNPRVVSVRFDAQPQQVEPAWVAAQPLEERPQVQVEASDRASRDERSAPAIPASSAVVQTREMPATVSADVPGGNLDQYLLRSQLTVPATLMADVIVPYPEVSLPDGRYATTLALFIDETGIVRRVRVEGVGLSALDEAAEQSFLHASFRPGELDGQPAKALVRIEVVFESSPVTALMPRSETND